MIPPEGATTVPETTEDMELAKAFKRGEPGAYEAIYIRFQPRVTSVCRRMLGNPHDCDEAAQEAFLRVYQALPRFNGRYQLGAWIARITTNVCLDQLRTRSRRPSVPSTLEELDAELSESAHEEGPEDFVMRRADSWHVRKILDGLPPMHRAAIILRDFEGLTYEEVAIALGISDAQCKALIHRARQNFKKSWVPASVAALLPFKLFDKLKPWRKVEATGAAEHGNQVARHAPQFADVAASASHTAASCSTFLGSCGAIVGEKFVGAAATVVIAAGSFAYGTHVAKSNPTPDGPSKDAVVAYAPEPRAGSFEVEKKRKAKKPKTDSGSLSPTPSQTVAPKPAEQPSTPQPSPSPSPSEPPKAGGGIGKETEGPPPAPPFQPFIGFEGSAGKASQITSHQQTVNCSSSSVLQTLHATIWDEDGAHPFRLNLSAGSTSTYNFEIDKGGKTYTYNGGAGSVTATKSGSEMHLAFTGSYGWNGGEHPTSGNLPRYGRFDAKLTLDCAASRVITENITLFVE